MAPATTAPAPPINGVRTMFFFFFLLFQIITKLNGKSKTLLQFVTFLIHLCLTSGLEQEPEPSEPEPYRIGAPTPLK
jgi:hypothetical protein